MRNYLKVWLAYRDKTITDMSRETGLSRTTLTSIAANRAEGINFETLNKICMYLDITPNELFAINLFTVLNHDNKEKQSRKQRKRV